MTATRVLVVDDDPAIRNMLAEYLGAHGYEVALAASGAAMRAEIERASPAVVLLDIGLPGEDGLTLARYLRERHQVGIIMVTGAGDVVDRVAGLEVGADDYIAKPFDPRELRARLKSVLRRLEKTESAKPQTALRVSIGRCFLDMKARSLADAKGREIPITSMEFDLLKALIEHPNQVLSRDQLLTMTRNREWEPFDRSIDIRITRLRRKVEEDPAHPRAIKTVRGAGYMFIPSRSSFNRFGPVTGPARPARDELHCAPYERRPQARRARRVGRGGKRPGLRPARERARRHPGRRRSPSWRCSPTPGARRCACSRSASTAGCARRSPIRSRARRAPAWWATSSAAWPRARGASSRTTISSPSWAWKATPPTR